MNKLDYIITLESTDSTYYDDLIKKSGFKLKKLIKIQNQSKNNRGFLHRITKILKSQTNYGPYNLYSR